MSYMDIVLQHCPPRIVGRPAQPFDLIPSGLKATMLEPKIVSNA